LARNCVFLVSPEWAGKCLDFCSGLRGARKRLRRKLMTLSTLKVVCFLLILEDTITRESAQPWNVCFHWGAACFRQEVWRPSCWDLSSHSV